MTLPEAWLRGPVEGVIPELHPVAHTLIGVAEEVREVLHALRPADVWAPVAGGWSVGHHVRHLAGSTRRLLAYAHGRTLTVDELAAARAEGAVPLTPPTASVLSGDVDTAFEAVRATLTGATRHDLTAPRSVGRAQLPSTVGGLLFHIAEHAQRHAGQVAVLARVLRTTR